MTQIITLLKGKKTYIIGALTILLGILQQNTEMIMAGLSMLTLRAGISKA